MSNSTQKIQAESTMNNTTTVELPLKSTSSISNSVACDNNTSNEFEEEKIDLEAEKAKELAKKKKYKKMFIIRIVIRLAVIAAMVTLIITLKINVNDYLQWLLNEIDHEFGPIWSPILFCLIFSVWTSLSPMGYLPTVLCGIFFKWYIAPFVAYISINIGSTINVLIIRYVILKYKDKYCLIATLLKICCGKKMGQVSFLKKLFFISSPIKIIILLRLPYLNNGVLNYLFSLQIDSVSIKQNIIGNLIGFIPGSILFSVFGAEIKSLTKVISQRGFDSDLQMILFIVISLFTIICYIAIALKVKSLIKKGGESMNRKVIINTSVNNDNNRNNEMDK